MDVSEKTYIVEKNNILEIDLGNDKKINDCLEMCEIDIVFTEPDGNNLKIPAFYDGSGKLKIRYASSKIGTHFYNIEDCSIKDFLKIENWHGIIDVKEYSGKNNLLKHGPLKVSKNKRYLEHIDGTPFLWLADTWWYALTKRLKWPDEYKLLTKDRVAKGFSVVQLIAGLLAELEIFDPQGENEYGWPWSKDLKRIVPSYFDAADLKIAFLVESGLVPCIFGSWGYYMEWLGVEGMKKHWRNLIARWGAYPVVWVVAGEANLPHYKFYQDDRRQKLSKQLKKDWSEVAKYIREVDPYKRLLTVHPAPINDDYSSRNIFTDERLFDFDMMQMSHFGTNTAKESVRVLKQLLSTPPAKPVLNGEVCYEALSGTNWEDVQRFLFWSHVLSGAAGHSYGASGVFLSSTGKEHGIPGSWTEYTWKQGLGLPGSLQLGKAKKFLEKFEWFKFQPHPEWVNLHSDHNNPLLPYAAGIPGKVRIIYFPGISYLYENCIDDVWKYQTIKIFRIEKDIDYIYYYFNPRNGETKKLQDISLDDEGTLTITGGFLSSNPTMEDWVLVIEKK